MKIVSYLTGTVALHASWDEIRPLKGAPHPSVLSFLQEKYNFQGVSNSNAAMQARLLTPQCETGVFGSSAFASLEFQPTFVVVGSTTTDLAEEILQDVLTSLKDNFGFRMPPPDRPKIYSSTIIADLGFSFKHTLGKWSVVQNLLNKMRGPGDFSLEPVALRFIGQSKDDYNASMQFTFEERIPAPEGEKFIFTQAPLKTLDHEKVLSEIEKIFAD